jgi:hypothetical protein
MGRMPLEQIKTGDLLFLFRVRVTVLCTIKMLVTDTLNKGIYLLLLHLRIEGGYYVCECEGYCTKF